MGVDERGWRWGSELVALVVVARIFVCLLKNNVSVVFWMQIIEKRKHKSVPSSAALPSTTAPPESTMVRLSVGLCCGSQRCRKKHSLQWQSKDKNLPMICCSSALMADDDDAGSGGKERLKKGC